MPDKIDLRRRIHSLKKSYSEHVLKDMSLAVIQKLNDNQRLQDANVVMAYYSLPDEVNTHELINELIVDKTVLLPVVIDDTNMEVRVYDGPSSLVKGAYNIMEPNGKTFNNLNDIDVILVPGVAFDKNKHRMGRGKGYYDRFLKTVPSAYKIGVCFDFQKMEEIPAFPHDVAMDEII